MPIADFLARAPEAPAFMVVRNAVQLLKVIILTLLYLFVSFHCIDYTSLHCPPFTSFLDFHSHVPSTATVVSVA